MEYRRLGRTGVTVSSLCLGAMMFGEWGTRALPTITSDSPAEYTSAVSMKLIPASRARWIILMLSSWSRPAAAAPPSRAPRLWCGNRFDMSLPENQPGVGRL